VTEDYKVQGSGSLKGVSFQGSGLRLLFAKFNVLKLRFGFFGETLYVESAGHSHFTVALLQEQSSKLA
jgi:hypothetical protein